MWWYVYTCVCVEARVRTYVRSSRDLFPERSVSAKENDREVGVETEGSSVLSVVGSWAERRGARRRV